MKATMHTNIFATSLRFALSNRALRREHSNSTEAITDYVTARKKERNTITISTKKTRPVFVDRENLDTPPVITDHVRELASLIRNTNAITAHEPRIFLHLDAILNRQYESKQRRYRPLWVCMSAPVKGKTRGRWYTEYGNIQPEDKPAFRHDSMFLFDTLSEDYNA